MRGLKLIILPLMLLVFTSVLAVCCMAGVLTSMAGVPLETGWFNATSNNTQQYSGTQKLNSSSSTFQSDVGGSMVSVTLGVGVYVVLVTSIALVTVSGITVLGSGLSSVSVMAIFKSAAFLSIWGLFSLPAVALFITIPWFGMPLYFFLTLIYSLGIVHSVGFGGG